MQTLISPVLFCCLHIEALKAGESSFLELSGAAGASQDDAALLPAARKCCVLMVGIRLRRSHLCWRIWILGQGEGTQIMTLSSTDFVLWFYFYKQNEVPKLGVCEEWLQQRGEGLETSFPVRSESSAGLPNTSKSAVASRLPWAIDVFTIQLRLLRCSCARDVLQVAGTPTAALQNVPAFLLNIQFIAMVL